MPDDPESSMAQEQDETQLCLHCVQPNRVDAHFCEHCGSPLTSFASTGPWEQVLAEGSAYRNAAEHPHRPIVVVGIWVVFGMLIMAGWGITVYSDAWWKWVGLALMGGSAAIVLRTTRNYFRLNSKSG